LLQRGGEARAHEHTARGKAQAHARGHRVDIIFFPFDLFEFTNFFLSTFSRAAAARRFKSVNPSRGSTLANLN